MTRVKMIQINMELRSQYMKVVEQWLSIEKEPSFILEIMVKNRKREMKSHISCSISNNMGSEMMMRTRVEAWHQDRQSSWVHYSRNVMGIIWLNPKERRLNKVDRWCQRYLWIRIVRLVNLQYRGLHQPVIQVWWRRVDHKKWLTVQTSSSMNLWSTESHRSILIQILIQSKDSHSHLPEILHIEISNTPW